MLQPTVRTFPICIHAQGPLCCLNTTLLQTQASHIPLQGLAWQKLQPPHPCIFCNRPDFSWIPQPLHQPVSPSLPSPQWCSRFKLVSLVPIGQTTGLPLTISNLSAQICPPPHSRLGTGSTPSTPAQAPMSIGFHSTQAISSLEYSSSSNTHTPLFYMLVPIPSPSTPTHSTFPLTLPPSAPQRG